MSNFQLNTISTIQDINNNRLSVQKAMPLKNITSDNNSTFAMYRKTYVETYSSQSMLATKKWYGNRDASQVTTNRRNEQVGVGSLNANSLPMSFNSNVEKNTVNDALRRVRGGGAVAPIKKNFSKSATYVPSPSFAPVNPNSTKPIYGLKSPYLYH
jgi:hypothetical protein